MKTITIKVPEKAFDFVLDLIDSLKHLGVEKDENAQLKAEIRDAVENLKLVKEGKLKARPVKDLIDEL